MSDSFTPIIVPVHTPPPTCPSCGNLESKKTICRHCDYEYKNDETFLGFLLAGVQVIGLCLVACWIFLTLGFWFLEADKTTLLDILLTQWKWVSGMRIW